MAHYKKDASSNRDALFGGSSSSSGGRPASSSSATKANNDNAAAALLARPSTLTLNSSPYTSSNAAAASTTITPGPSTIFATPGRGIASSSPSTMLMGILSGSAKVSKMAEAEDYRAKASKAMTRGVFTRPDPISAANYYKRAAESYKACGEYRLEKLHRIASADCQRGQGAYATAAAEYTRAAELVEVSATETLDVRRRECHRLHLDAAAMYEEMGEHGRCAESTLKAAFGLVMGMKANESLVHHDASNNNNSTGGGAALVAIEEAIEMFVGDPLNGKRDYRRTGVSRYAVDPTSTFSTTNNTTPASLELATKNIVTEAYAHELLYKVGNELLHRQMYASALYAYGAGTAILLHEGYATISLYKSYVSTCIITLAMGDVVAASREYERTHLQNTGYLTSRECALEEDLIRACTAMDDEALTVARSRTGPHKAALANLDPIIRELVMEVRVSGRAFVSCGGGSGSSNSDTKKNKKEGVAAPTSKKVSSLPPRGGGIVEKGEEEDLVARDTDAGFDEMDDIMNQMGLNDDDDGDDDDDDDDGRNDNDDDEIDLR